MERHHEQTKFPEKREPVPVREHLVANSAANAEREPHRQPNGEARQRLDAQSHGFVLTPGRYVGVEAQEVDSEPFIEKMQRLTQDLHAQFAESAKLEMAIKENLRKLGYVSE